MPNTGVYRTYDFTLSRGKISPDGYQKDVILVNGQFPGPAIEANCKLLEFPRMLRAYLGYAEASCPPPSTTFGPAHLTSCF